MREIEHKGYWLEFHYQRDREQGILHMNCSSLLEDSVAYSSFAVSLTGVSLPPVVPHEWDSLSCQQAHLCCSHTSASEPSECIRSWPGIHGMGDNACPAATCSCHWTALAPFWYGTWLAPQQHRILLSMSQDCHQSQSFSSFSPHDLQAQLPPSGAPCHFWDLVTIPACTKELGTQATY